MSEILASAENLNLIMSIPKHRAISLRSAIVNAISHPIKTFRQQSADSLHLLKDINLKIAQGERVGILGANGSGKTSLCRCLAGIYAPTTGKVHIPEHTRAVFNASVGFHSELTGRENAQLLASLLYPEVDDSEQLVEESLAFSELGDFIDAPFRIYSSGMQIRLCLSLISARPAELLILDEIFEGADLSFREKISKRIESTMLSSGGVVFVSHSESQIERVCTRAIVLKGGHIAFSGPPKEAYAFYRNSLGIS